MTAASTAAEQSGAAARDAHRTEQSMAHEAAETAARFKKATQQAGTKDSSVYRLSSIWVALVSID